MGNPSKNSSSGSSSGSRPRTTATRPACDECPVADLLCLVSPSAGVRGCGRVCPVGQRR
ncbi:hypothetical protein ACIQF5_29015 [Streptomyces goshikiensis]|uniref:hypothetical protein n=1 Tax=Streptomyces goshikiensis TaxID=1942 RepID=UPI0037F40F0D